MSNMPDKFCQCGTKIQDWNGPNGKYTEITLEFDDGSAHETCICKECAYNMDSQPEEAIRQAEAIYAKDIADWRKDDNGNCPDSFWKFVKARNVKSIKQGSRYI